MRKAIDTWNYGKLRIENLSSLVENGILYLPKLIKEKIKVRDAEKFTGNVS